MIFFEFLIGAAVLFGIVFFTSRAMDRMPYGAKFDAPTYFVAIEMRKQQQ